MSIFSFLFGSKSSKENKIKEQRLKAPVSGPHVVTNLKSYPSEIVGESFYQNNLKIITGGFKRDSQTHDLPGLISLDPDNQYDKNAVRVDIEGKIVGFLPKDQALRVGAIMKDQGVTCAAVDARIRGGWRTNQHDEGQFGVCLRMPTTGWIDLGVGAQRPQSKINNTQVKRENRFKDGPLKGQKIVLWVMSEKQSVSNAITEAGGTIMKSLGKTSTMIVLDDAPITEGQRRSAHWRKFELLKNEGQSINLVKWSELSKRIDGRAE